MVDRRRSRPMTRDCGEYSISASSRRREWLACRKLLKKAAAEMNCGREQILSDYGYRIDKVKYNLLIDVDDPSID